MDVVLLFLLVALLGLQLYQLIAKNSAADLAPVLSRLDSLEKNHERTERSLKDEFSRSRQESDEQARGLRTEVQSSLKASTDALVQSLDRISSAQQTRLEDFAKQLTALKQAGEQAAAQQRTELTETLSRFKEAQDKRLTDTATLLQQQFESFGRRLTDFGQQQQENSQTARQELTSALKDFRDSLTTQLAGLADKNEKKFDELRTAVEAKLTQLQADNTSKLEEMRRTVDEKLQGTLEKRLGESFKQVSDRLEQVHKGLGEVQSLATGVGDLKRVLTNVKTRGTWGEMQLGNLLEQILTTEQYATNVRTKPAGRETVEFAIKLPGRDTTDPQPVWLPLDAKFPKEDYERLVDASEKSDAAGVEQAAKDLELRLRAQARDIRDKYIAPPHTTDFGLLYLPVEGLYAEVIRRPGLVDALQREYRVVIVGPTTLAALLNSLQMGFRTLAIQKQSSEVWKVLGAVKTDFGKFGDLLDKVKKKLDETGTTIEHAVHRSRQLERKLRKVEALPAAETLARLADTDTPEPDSETDDNAPAS